MAGQRLRIIPAARVETLVVVPVLVVVLDRIMGLIRALGPVVAALAPVVMPVATMAVVLKVAALLVVSPRRLNNHQFVRVRHPIRLGLNPARWQDSEEHYGSRNPTWRSLPAR